MRNVLAALGISVFFSVPAFAADRCIGAVVNGECMGTVMPDYSRQFDRPADTWVNPKQGLHTSPYPDYGVEGNQFYQRNKPLMQGGELRWYDPKELGK